ncbi:MAG: hypothetical protein LBS59_01015 [Puniceicoccales bacterium]|nr:hypothetical protein [Puniceicoccales bacterium]
MGPRHKPALENLAKQARVGGNTMLADTITRKIEEMTLSGAHHGVVGFETAGNSKFV